MKDIIINEYKNGKSSSELERKYGIYRVKILRWLKSNGITPRNKSLKRKYIVDIPKSKISEIISLYKHRNKINDISTLTNIGRHLILKILHNQGVKIRSHQEEQKRIHINENYFDNIDNQRKSYFLGLLYADGCVSKNGGVSLSLSGEDDRNILQEFIKDICPNYHLCSYKPKKGKIVYTISLRRIKLAQSLKQQGCIERKSLKLKELPKVNKHLLPHFIRGYFDGDGCVYKHNLCNSLNIDIIGTKKFLLNILDILSSYEIYGNIYKTSSKNKKTYSIKIGNKKSVDNFKSFIYNNATIFLERKKKKFYEISS
jgi:hypothetical protein